MIQFTWGALAMGSAIAALFFLRFWRETTDRLFVFFALAFSTLSVHWVALGIVNPVMETRHQLYVVRLAAFVLILIGILDKNARATRAGGPR